MNTHKPTTNPIDDMDRRLLKMVIEAVAYSKADITITATPFYTDDDAHVVFSYTHNNGSDSDENDRRLVKGIEFYCGMLFVDSGSNDDATGFWCRYLV